MRITAGLLVWLLALVMVAFGVIESWRGDSTGEMLNYIVAGFALRFFAKDLDNWPRNTPS